MSDTVAARIIDSQDKASQARPRRSSSRSCRGRLQRDIWSELGARARRHHAGAPRAAARAREPRRRGGAAARRLRAAPTRAACARAGAVAARADRGRAGAAQLRRRHAAHLQDCADTLTQALGGPAAARSAPDEPRRSRSAAAAESVVRPLETAARRPGRRRAPRPRQRAALSCRDAQQLATPAAQTGRAAAAGPRVAAAVLSAFTGAARRDQRSPWQCSSRSC